MGRMIRGAAVVAGLAIAWHAGTAPPRTPLTRSRPLVVSLGILVVLLGPGSAAMPCASE